MAGIWIIEIDENGGNVLYNYNAIGELASVSQIVSSLSDTQTMQTDYTYENDRVKSITHNGFSYNYEYDVWGNVTSVKVGNQPLVSYNYGSNENRNCVNKITYGNGDYTEYTFTTEGNISTVKSCKENGTVTSHYVYSYENGTIKSIKDLVERIQTDYNGNTVSISKLKADCETIAYTYSLYTVTDSGEIRENYGGVGYTTSKGDSVYISETGGTKNTSTLSTHLKEYKFTSETDYFGRIVSKNTKTFYSQEEDGLNVDMFFNSEYKYKDLANSQTTTLVDSYKSTVGLCAEVEGELLTDVFEEVEYFYEYDDVGNITRIYFKEFDDDGSLLDETTVCSYEYDTAGQLIRENNKTLEKTYVFVYDVGGNIVSKDEYDFTEDDLSELSPTDTISYSYDSVWKDKLVNYNGETITYDEIGNPLNYVKQDVIDGSAYNGTLTWNGRQLESVTIDGTIYRYSYDSDGLRIRTEKYDSDTNKYEGAVNYIWRDGKLSAYSNENSEGVVEQNIKMLFDDTGETIGYTYYNLEENQQATFYFAKNVFGDIVTVYDDDGEAMVTYSYDAWGCVTAKAHGKTATEIIAALVALMFTPITYRGYNYDLNTGLYYLQSRYYNPAYGRFLNADDTDILEATKGTIHGANLFAYCNNNPVMNVDYTGELTLPLIIFILVTILVLVGFVILLPYLLRTYNNLNEIEKEKATANKEVYDLLFGKA